MPSPRFATVQCALLLLAGCTTMDPVAMTQPVNEREGADSRITSERTTVERSTGVRATAIEQQIDQMNQRLDQVGGRVDRLEGGVAAAQRRADEAAKRAETVDGRLTRLWSNRFNQKPASSLEVYFSPDSVELSDAAQTALAWVATELEEHPTLTVELGGYTDPKGAIDYNYALSQRRVDVVKKFLMDRGVQLTRIQSASLGPLTNAGIPDAKKRRVTLRLFADQE